MINHLVAELVLAAGSVLAVRLPTWLCKVSIQSIYFAAGVFRSSRVCFRIFQSQS